MFAFDVALRERIADHLGGHERRAIDDGGRKRAAVAVVVVESDGAAAFVLCRRAARMNSHSFQWALPGGRLDAGETAIDAARPRAPRGARCRPRRRHRARPARRLRDPFGLRHHARRAVGRRPARVHAGARTRCTPCTGSGSTSCAATTRRASSRSPRAPAGRRSSRSWARLVHAPTAAVLVQFRWLALEGNHDPVAHFEQPVFAWKIDPAIAEICLSECGNERPGHVARDVMGDLGPLFRWADPTIR